ncbi:MAG TPA: TIGR03790 family protein, partial [Planctomycetaceae bacterium]|nr:TIGR03790 family protein [Planctomycetaceae bacterium]
MLVLLVLALIAPGTLQAALGPEEVAIIAMQASPESLDVARYYAAARKVPTEHILELPGQVGIELDRKQWETVTAPFIRNWLKSKQLDGKIRCFVTVWDVPLKIGRRPGESSQVQGVVQVLDQEYARRLDRVAQIVTALDRLLPGDAEQKTEKFPPTATVPDVTKRLEEALKGAQQRIGQEQGEPERGAASLGIERLFVLAGGLSGYLRTQLKAAEANPDLSRRLEAVRGEYQGIIEGLTVLNDLPESPEVVRGALVLRDKADGLLGSLKWIHEHRELVQGNETYASFDSELSLLYWPAYPLLRERANVLHYAYDGNAVRETHPTLMVSRLEAPTIELTKGLVDAAIEAEQAGLTGKFYIDSRGLDYDGKTRGSYGDYDEALRHLAKLVQKETKWDVVFDNRPELFEPDSCLDAALYCGWYSHAKYIDSFTWNRGAVAYHIASSEAVTLRDANSEVWCKRMLEKGVCATLGPVHEPYLHAFPRPDEFFPALMSGRYTLAESYYRTLPSNSWVM